MRPPGPCLLRGGDSAALGLDTRIGPKYLKGAVSYGGPCFPRDNRALAALASRVGASSGLAEATDIFNRAQIKSVAEIVKSYHSGSQSIGILGLTYKPDTDIVEESFGLLLAQELSSSDLSVIVYDPSREATLALGSHKNIRAAYSAAECIAESGVVVLATPWKEFRKVPKEHWTHNRQPWAVSRVVIDCWCALDHLNGVDSVRYVRLGFGGAAERRVEATSSAL